VFFRTDARKVRICDLKLRRMERFTYEYDFGDSWVLRRSKGDFELVASHRDRQSLNRASSTSSTGLRCCILSGEGLVSRLPTTDKPTLECF